eukprot:CAMPEP_0195508136 /NCGR_PEP_ID=MMETSP0794_2-20130614/1425_1 /TAXON_ID=515487 /ORGANISM="Stephanopyxis turris, Strain CCMP 815" /LENGTH=1245 /DNA_ID=CAMNT_0040635023 /DNA_START=59 /DNA_END=3796 /DNA_ORIENTATION=-
MSELLSLLTPETSILKLSSKPPNSPPPSGTLLLYDRNLTRNYKDDRYCWKKKRNSTKVREDHVKLRVDGQFRVAGCYVHCSDTPTMHRRAYRLLDPTSGATLSSVSPSPETGSGGNGDGSSSSHRQSLVLVHYLDTAVASTVSASLSDSLGSNSIGGGGKKGSKSGSSTTKNGGKRSKSPVPKKLSIERKNEATRQGFATATDAGTNELQQSNLKDDPVLKVPGANSIEGTHDDSIWDDQLGSSRPDSPLMQMMGHTRARSTYDDETLDILWSMVMEEGADNGEGVVDIQEAAANAIEEHFNPTMEEQLVDTMEQAVREQNLAPAVDFSALSSRNQQLNPTFEKQLAATMEKQLYANPSEDHRALSGLAAPAASMSKSIFASSLPQEQEDKQRQANQNFFRNGKHEQNHFNRQQQSQNSFRSFSFQQKNQENMPFQKETQTNSAVSINDKSANSSIEMEHREQLIKSQREVQSRSFLQSSNAHSHMEQMVSLQSSGSQAILPEIVDFTPDHALIRRKKSTKMVLSTSETLSKIPEGDAVHTWHLLAAFIDIVPVNPASSSSNVSDVVFKNVALASLRMLTPFSFRCELPNGVPQPGFRSIILVGVRLTAGFDPLCEAVCSAVALAMQSEWRGAPANSSYRRMIGNNISGPTFLSPPSGTNILLYSQFSKEFFEFEDLPEEVKIPSAHGSFTSTSGNQSKVGKFVTSSTTSSKNGDGCNSTKNDAFESNNALPAPSPAMASIASAMIGFPNPLDVLVHDTENKSCIDTEARVRNRKRRAPFDLHHYSLPAKEISNGELATTPREWITAPGLNGDGTFGDSVKRHCKIRFVERLTSFITESKEGEQNPISSGPKSSEGEHTGENTVVDKDDVGGLAFPDEDKLQSMDDDELEALLDGLLIRIVESLVATSSNDDDIRKQLNDPGETGFTLLHYASLYNLSSLIPMLLTRGANPDTPTLRGKLTPLHLACGAGNWAIVELLSRNGCSMDVKDSFDQSPADHAEQNGFTDIATWIRKKCGKVESQIEVDRKASSVQPNGLNDRIKNDSPAPNNRALLSESEVFPDLSMKDKLAFNYYVRHCKNTNTQGAGHDATDESKGSSGNSNNVSNNGNVDKQVKENLSKTLHGESHERLGIPHSDNMEFSLLNKPQESNLSDFNAVHSDVRQWLLRSNVDSLRDASLKLQSNGGDKKSNTHETSQNTIEGDNGNSGNPQPQNEFKLNQVLASLVMRKNLLRSSAAGGDADFNFKR